MSGADTSGSESFSADLVRTHDFARYASTLFMPSDLRRALLALYAFNVEISRVREQITQPLPGEIRLHWWTDMLAGVDHGGVEGHPVAAELLLTIGFMSISQVDFDLTSIAALLTILGYSLNDTVVIYDRIREMLRRYKKMPMPQLLNESINSTLSRSIVTHVTVTLALLALLLFGGSAIHSFTAVMMFGVVLVGTYTSIFIAAPILIYLGVGTHRADAPDVSPKK